MTNQQINIVNGPGEMDLMLSLFRRKEVSFTIEVNGKKEKVDVSVLIIGSEDGSIPMWIVSGFKGMKFFKCSYRSDTRQGIWSWVESINYPK